MDRKEIIENRNKLIERQDEIIRLIGAGYRIVDIAKTYGVSRERIYQIKKQGKIKPYREQKNPRHRIIFELGGVCAHCGFSDIRALQIDHIDGGGVRQVKEMGGSHKMYKYIEHLSQEEKRKHYQVLCANCNWIKRHEKGEISKAYLKKNKPTPVS